MTNEKRRRVLYFSDNSGLSSVIKEKMQKQISLQNAYLQLQSAAEKKLIRNPLLAPDWSLKYMANSVPNSERLPNTL